MVSSILPSAGPPHGAAAGVRQRSGEGAADGLASLPPARPSAALPGYAELMCRSNFSFLAGASQPEELVTRAQALGYAALAITDECSLSGVVRAHAQAQRCGLSLIVGVLMRLSSSAAPSAPPSAAARSVLQGASPAPSPITSPPASPPASPPVSPPVSPRRPPARPAGPSPAASPGPAGARLVLLAQSRRGYGNLVHWVTLARRRAPKGEYRALASDVEGRAPTAPMLAGLPDCIALLVPEPGQAFESLFAQALWLKTWFGVERARLGLCLNLVPGELELQEHLQRLSALTGLAIVAVGDVRMHARSRKPLLDVLTATRLKCAVSACGWALTANAEAHLRSRARLAQLHAPQWLAATLEVAGRCAFSLAQLRYEYPREIVPDGHTPVSWLRSLTEAGAVERYPQGLPSAVRAMVEHELALIAQLQYEPYFLTVADIVHWARGQGILCQGRGSAANSAVCYCLGVTAVDPTLTTLLFERFISAERNEPPDIDIDFEHQRREEVIQYIYRKYGRHRAALTGVVISYRPRSALRDVGRALGIDLDRIDAVAKSAHWWDGRRIDPERLQENGFDPGAPVSRLWMELTGQLVGFPRHLSQHPGGFVIARDDLAQLVPVENAAMEGRSVIQWDKDDLDALGLIKVDILALGMLSAIRRALALVGSKRGTPLELYQIPREDPEVYAMLSRGDSVGTFQVESRAQMSMLPRLKPQCFYDLVIEVAIVRPGPIQGGMVHPYLRRRNGEEPIDYPSDEVRQALQRTLGVPIFQEQVMQLAILAADFTPGEADQLRRAMAAWKRKGGLEPFHERLVGRMLHKGYTEEFAERIFKQIQGFGEYGFPESHAASFALLVYASAWLKRWHPDAFLAALLNSQPMGFYAPAQLVRDAREHGVTVLPVDVNLSAWETILEPGNTPDAQGLLPVRLGLSRIGGLAEAAAQRLVAARIQAPFDSAEDLARRAQLDARELQLLAQADALQPLTGHRRQAAWAVAGVDTRATPMLRRTRTHEASATLAPADAAGETLADYRATGLSLKNHPLALLREQLRGFKVQTAAELRAARPGQLARASGIVTHRQRPGTAKGVVFVTLEDETGHVNIIVWPAVVEAQRRPLLASRLLTVYGVWQREGEVMHLVARKLVDHTALLQGLATSSRDFH
ncbi:MAG: error-prone DNA polymerase [Rubrivivax sp.]|nr:error-prone DNA polymerase [Rubrivivax sp.]